MYFCLLHFECPYLINLASELFEDQILHECQAACMPEHDGSRAVHLLHPFDGTSDYILKAPTWVRLES